MYSGDSDLNIVQLQLFQDKSGTLIVVQVFVFVDKCVPMILSVNNDGLLYG